MTRFGWVIATYVAALGATASAFLNPVPQLIWNASASVPTGLYAVHAAHTLQVTELVVVRPPEDLARFLAERRYLPKGVPMAWCKEVCAGSPASSSPSTLRWQDCSGRWRPTRTCSRG